MKISGESVSADQAAADEFPDAINKIVEKEYLPEQVFNATKVTHSGLGKKK